MQTVYNGEIEIYYRVMQTSDVLTPCKEDAKPPIGTTMEIVFETQKLFRDPKPGAISDFRYHPVYRIKWKGLPESGWKNERYIKVSDLPGDGEEK